MSKATITVVIEVEGNIPDIVEAAEDFLGAVSDHFRPIHYPSIELKDSSIKVDNHF